MIPNNDCNQIEILQDTFTGVKRNVRRFKKVFEITLLRAWVQNSCNGFLRSFPAI